MRKIHIYKAKVTYDVELDEYETDANSLAQAVDIFENGDGFVVGEALYHDLRYDETAEYE